ncbi:MAG TPA: glycosyltransferase family 9 protein, partial [Candidatus Goldiibacteriota bacterium]|nr:glycosyltransferase family 9 protein [Candidatus Goldiibacteriota bacterium]
MLKIAVIKTDGIGDAVLASPFLFELRKNYRQAHITGFLSPAGGEILGGLGVFDEIVIHDARWLRHKKEFFLSRWFSALELLLKINKGKYDIVIGLRWQDRLTSLLVSLCRARDKYGYDTGGMGFCINHKIPALLEKTHVVRRNMRVLSLMFPKRKFRIKLGAAYVKETQAAAGTVPLKLSRHKRYIVIHPVSGCPAKDWPPEKYGELAGMLAKKIPVYIIGGPNDRAAASITGKNIVNTTARLSIIQTSGLIRQSSLVIGNDSAAVHMAAAHGVNSLTLFSGTADYREWGAYGKKSFILVKGAACANCGLSECDKSAACCMDFSAEQVRSFAMGIIAGKQRKNIVIL